MIKNLFTYDLANQTITNNTYRDRAGADSISIHKIGEIFINFINYDFSQYELLRKAAYNILPNSNILNYNNGSRDEIDKFLNQFPPNSFNIDYEFFYECVCWDDALIYIAEEILRTIKNIPYCYSFSIFTSTFKQFGDNGYFDFLYLQKQIIANWIPCIIVNNPSNLSAVQKYMKKNNLTFFMDGVSFKETTVFRYAYSIEEDIMHEIESNANTEEFAPELSMIENHPKQPPLTQVIKTVKKDSFPAMGNKQPEWENREIEIIHGYTFKTPEEALQCEFLKMLELGIKIRKCAVCGKYFIITGHNGKCCDNLYKDTGLTCQQVFADRNYRNKRKGNPILKEYDKAYKRMYARYSSKKNLTSDEYAKWKNVAAQERDKALKAYAETPSDTVISSFKQFLNNK